MDPHIDDEEPYWHTKLLYGAYHRKASEAGNIHQTDMYLHVYETEQNGLMAITVKLIVPPQE